MTNLTPDQRLDLERRLNAWLAEPPDEELRSFHRLCHTNDYLRELWLSGEWLSDRLREHGATKEQVHDVCFANGQRCFGQPDPWAVADWSLAKFVAGKPDVPGPALAAEINKEIFGDIFG